MANRPKHRESLPEHCKQPNPEGRTSRNSSSGCSESRVPTSLAGNGGSPGAARLSSLKSSPCHTAFSRTRNLELQTPNFAIGFCSFQNVDPEEERLRATLKEASDFI